MIIELNEKVNEERAHELAKVAKAFCIYDGTRFVLINSSSQKEIPVELEGSTDKFYVFESDLQLGSRKYRNETRSIQLGKVQIGGNSGNTMVIGGPCSVESEEQIRSSASLMKDLGISTLRAGSYKPPKP